MELMGIGLDLMAIIITFVILIGVLLGKKNAMNEYFPMLLLMNALMILADMGAIAFAGSAKSLLAYKAFLILQGSFVFVTIDGFMLYVDRLIFRRAGKKAAFRVFGFLISAIMILLWVFSMQLEYFYSVSDAGIYSRGKLFFIYPLVGVLMVVLVLIRTLINHVKDVLNNRVAGTIYIFAMLPLAVLYFAIHFKMMSIFNAAVTVSYFIMYILIHVFAEQAAVEQKMDETIMSTDLTISQLQPHFMFNSLTNIKYLIKSNPTLATEAIDKFTKYLRRNLDTIADPSPISFADEMEHTKIYLWLEQVRFSNLKVEYSIDVEDFMIPPLSLQPIVENAVKHGVTKKLGTGTVKILVREQEDCYKIVVKDDGLGFNMEESNAENKEQASITEIRRRLMEFNKSTIVVNSKEGVGTTVTYKIRKEMD